MTFKNGLPTEDARDRSVYSYEDIANVYYGPEQHGLEVIGDADVVRASYEFHLVVVWRDKQTRQLYAGCDSGCSCPTPFDGVGDPRVELKAINHISELDKLVTDYFSYEKPRGDAQYRNLRHKVIEDLHRRG